MHKNLYGFILQNALILIWRVQLGLKVMQLESSARLKFSVQLG